MRKPRLNLVGRDFGTFIVVADGGKIPNGQYAWLCVCGCGIHFVRTTSNIFNGNRRGCMACGRKSAASSRRTHGEAGKNRASPLYKRWGQMKKRCFDKKWHAYHRYGGRGISLCHDWMAFGGFRDWANAHGFQPHLTIERINPDGNYEPSNCEWITKSENTRRRNIAVGIANRLQKAMH